MYEKCGAPTTDHTYYSNMPSAVRCDCEEMRRTMDGDSTPRRKTSLKHKTRATAVCVKCSKSSADDNTPRRDTHDGTADAVRHGAGRGDAAPSKERLYAARHNYTRSRGSYHNVRLARRRAAVHIYIFLGTRAALWNPLIGGRLVITQSRISQAEGRVLTDRSMKTALPLTTPRQVRKSSTNDSESRLRT